MDFTADARAIEDEKREYEVFGAQVSFGGHAADGSGLAVSTWATEHGGVVAGLVVTGLLVTGLLVY